MKLLFDQNISHRIIPLLPVQFAGSTSVKGESLVNFSDRQIWKFAKENQFIHWDAFKLLEEASKLYL